MPLILEHPPSIDAAINQRNQLAEALYRLLVAQHVLNTDGVCTGPLLLMAVQDVLDQ